MDTSIRHRRQSQKGFTLFELMISLVIFGLVIIGTISLVQSFRQAMNAETDQIDQIIEQAQHAMNMLERDLQEAGFGVIDHEEFLR